MAVPSVATDIGEQYLRAFDQRYPGLLTGLYLVGSIALDDYREGASDIDFIAVSAGPVSADRVAPIHADLRSRWPRPHFDGVYLTNADLGAPAADAPSGVSIIEGTVVPNSRAERHAVTWLTLRRSGVALRGPPPSDQWIHGDIDAARVHARQNLVEYWRPWVEQHRNMLSPAGLHSLAADAVIWSVLGVSRLHATIAEGTLLSKTGAGEYAAAQFPGHARIINCALALRRGETGDFPGGPLVRRDAMLAYLNAAIDDALSL